MGSPIAPLLADVCMNWIFDQASPLLDHNTVLIRYVEDIFCVASNQAVFDNIFRILSSIHSSIQFSQEMEQHHQLSFLDVLLTRNGNTLQTSVYRKTTHTGLYTKWTSLCPLKFKRNLINCLLHRAYTICSSYIGMHKEFEFITTMQLKNGYPLNFIQTQICRFLDSKHQISNSKPPDENLRRMIFKLPYIGNASVHLEKELQSFYRRELGNKVRLVVIHSTFGIGNRFRYKDKQPVLHRNNVVYKLNCSCGASYIGQTRRNLFFRLQEHNPQTRTNHQTDVTSHLLENPSHSIEFDQPEILATANNLRELLIKETLLIHEHNPSINSDESSTPLYLFNT